MQEEDMMSEITGLKPRVVWKHFYNISRIPRTSGKEAKVREFIKKFAENLGLSTYVDKTGNLVVRKPAAPGMENRKTICLQGHLDVVPQKRSDVLYDFDEDSIEPYIDGEWVTADGITLGADGGIGVAAAMAVLESKNISHGPLEALFTVEEENGFMGAFGLKPNMLKAEILINLDTDAEGQLFIGSAAAQSTSAAFKYAEEPVDPNSAAYELRLTGLRGGHSGLDIHMGWGNAIKLLNRFLCQATKNWNVRVASIDGGNFITAIPCEAFAVVTVPGEKLTVFTKRVKEFEETVRSELSDSEPDAMFEAVAVEMPHSIIDPLTFDGVVRAICDCPSGVTRMSSDVEGLAHTSTNLGTIKSGEGKIKVGTLQRSFDKHAMAEVGLRIKRIFKWAGASEIRQKALIPAWNPEMDSPVLKEMQDIYRDLFGREAKIKVVHSGVECGVLKNIFPNMEIVSIGPNIYFPHTPNERVDIGSVKDFWKFLSGILNRVGKR
jgi:dipeptidase D